MDSVKSRNSVLDVEKGLGILIVISAHAGFFSDNMLVYVNSFYMPLFFIISGFFYNDKYSLSTFIKRKVDSLLIPYILCGGFHLILWCLTKYIGMNLQLTPKEAIIGFLWNNNVNFPIAGALWFLTCLFGTSVLFRIIGLIRGDILKFVLCCVITLFGLYIKFFLPWSFNTMFVALGFYGIGYLIKKYELLRNRYSFVSSICSIISIFIVQYALINISGGVI